MKTIVTLVLFNLSIATAQTSVYHPFPEQYATWLSSCLHYNDPPNVYAVGEYYIMNGNDTMIGSYNYNMVFDYNGLPTHGIRQDTAARKVYAVDFTWNISGYNPSDHLLYDFSLNVGDVFTARWLCDCDSNTIVQSIDSMLIGNNYRKRFNMVPVNGMYPCSVIEGIGSTSGLFDIKCFEILCSLSTFTDSTGVYVSLAEKNDHYAIGMFPNPVRQNDVLKINADLNNAVIMITDYSGKLINSFVCREGVIPVNYLEPGVYIFNIFISGNYYNEKLVVLR